MTNEERDIIAKFIARVAGVAPQQGAWGGGASVPATQPQPPPIDPEADRFIAEQFQAYPVARYRITQLAFVQEQALVEAQNRLRRMEWEVQQAQRAAQQSGGQRQGGGFFSSLFGGGRSSGAPGGGPWGQAPGQGYGYGAPPPPQYPPGYQPGVFQRAGGSGFLGSALTTAAGVAGGVLAADAIRDLFSPHQGLGGVAGEGGFLGGGGAAADPGYVDQGTWTDPNAGAAPDQGYVDQGSWDQGGGQSGWGDSPSPPDDTSGGGWDQGGGGWDQGGGGGSDDSLT